MQEDLHRRVQNTQQVPDGMSRLGSQRGIVGPVIVAALLTGVVALVCFAPTNAQGVRYYAGYAFLVYEFPLPGPPYGVSARIYTINKNVPTGQFYAQWPTAVLSYAMDYWVQVGYTKGYDTNYQLKWYAEKIDATGYKKPVER